MARFKIRPYKTGSDTKGTYAIIVDVVVPGTPEKPGGHTYVPKAKDGGPMVDVWCPGCGRLQGLGDHRIQNDGTVEPSLDCFYDDCKFHEHVVLEGWKEG